MNPDAREHIVAARIPGIGASGPCLETGSSPFPPRRRSGWPPMPFDVRTEAPQGVELFERQRDSRSRCGNGDEGIPNTQRTEGRADAFCSESAETKAAHVGAGRCRNQDGSITSRLGDREGRARLTGWSGALRYTRSSTPRLLSLGRLWCRAAAPGPLRARCTGTRAEGCWWGCLSKACRGATSSVSRRSG
jgi:hypothetical protein